MFSLLFKISHPPIFNHSLQISGKMSNTILSIEELKLEKIDVIIFVFVIFVDQMELVFIGESGVLLLAVAGYRFNLSEHVRFCVLLLYMHKRFLFALTHACSCVYTKYDVFGAKNELVQYIHFC